MTSTLFDAVLSVCAVHPLPVDLVFVPSRVQPMACDVSHVRGVAIDHCVFRSVLLNIVHMLLGSSVSISAGKILHGDSRDGSWYVVA